MPMVIEVRARYFPLHSLKVAAVIGQHQGFKVELNDRGRVVFTRDGKPVRRSNLDGDGEENIFTSNACRLLRIGD